MIFLYLHFFSPVLTLLIEFTVCSELVGVSILCPLLQQKYQCNKLCVEIQKVSCFNLIVGGGVVVLAAVIYSFYIKIQEYGTIFKLH